MESNRPWLAHYPSGLPADISADATNLLDAFRRTVRRAGDQPAVMYFDGVMTFAQLDARSDAFAAHLAQHQVGDGDRVAVYLQNDPAFVVAVLGTWKAGASVVAMNPMYRQREVEFLVADSGARVMVGLDDNYDEVIAPILAARTTRLSEILLVSGHDDQTRDDERVLPAIDAPARVTRFAEVIRSGAVPESRDTPEPADLAMLMYTSGTTGKPKGAIITHGAAVFAAQTYREWVGLGPDDRILGVAPLFHITGFMGHVAVSLLTGAALVLNHRFNGDVVVDAIREHRPTFTVGSVTVFNNLAGRPDVVPADFASFRAVCSGGAPIAPALAETIRSRTGFYLHNLYGMTETNGPAVGVPIGSDAPVDPNSGALAIGLPVFNTMVRIVDDDGSELPPGEVGEIHIRGPQVIPAYWNRPEATSEKLHDGEIATGDVGFMDENGWFYLVDRKGDLINASGYKVSPSEVEEVLYAHPAVQEVAVIGVPDGYRGETVKAFVVLTSGSSASAEELIIHCKAQMAAYKYPRLIEFRDELPKSVTGKILRRELRTAEA